MLWPRCRIGKAGVSAEKESDFCLADSSFKG